MKRKASKLLYALSIVKKNIQFLTFQAKAATVAGNREGMGHPPESH